MAWALVERDRRNDFSPLRGFVFGLLAFLVGYLTFYLARDTRIDELLSVGGTAVQGPAPYEVVGWVFFSAHHVSSGISALGRTETLPIQGSPVWEVWFLLVPVVVLVALGSAAAWASNATDGFNGFSAGAALVVGYLPMAVLANFLFTTSASYAGGTVTAGPNLLLAAIVAGVLYPVVCGGIGGAIAGLIR